MSERPFIQNVPTNIITGFLGAGKTTAILHLLDQKPEGERWAVLVNEFGEIGVDGGLITGQQSDGKEVFIKEVPGGCMCCAAGLPMQIALSQLLHRAQPDRLLIEPTGLGHPLEVLGTLRAPHYQGVLRINQIITLVDARKIKDPRYTEHATFRQQVAIADRVVGNKQDLYGQDEKSLLMEYVAAHGSKGVSLSFVVQGYLSVDMLEGETGSGAHHNHNHDHDQEPQPLQSEAPLPDSGYLCARNSGEGFESIGWRFSPEHLFVRSKLYPWLTGLSVERMKAVFITDKGIFGYNMTSDGTLSELELDECVESRVEIISSEIDSAWEEAILSSLQAG